MTVFLGAIATLVTAMGLIHAAIATGTASASPPIEKDPCCAVNHCTSSALPSDERPPITLADYARSARNSAGDPARGRALFADLKRVACVRCHRVRGQGGEVGPDLSDIGGKYDREQLIESVLEPSRQIVEGYRPVAVATTNGRVVTGIVREEVADKLLLVDIDGKRLSVRKQEVVERKTMDISLMPDGFFQGLSLKEFSDLIAYLASLRAAGQGTPGSGVVGPVALPRGFTRASVASGITGATAMDVAPDGRVLVCEQTGALRVVKDGAMLPRPFVRVVVDSEWERGLIGVALDPDFARNGFVYLCYIAASPYIHHRVSRFQARGDVAEPASERVLFEGDDQAKLGGHTPAGHQGGAIHFGADGKLYIAIGDQTAGAPSQRLDTFQGKLLRLNPDGSIPTDNPFFDAAKGKYRAIWALGLRNPFTFAVQPVTGRIFINDVGEARWEEIDEGFAGANYGWPLAEGPSTNPHFRAPIHSYPVASISGGAFCPVGKSVNFPPTYQGRYFFADFVKGWVKVLDPEHPEHIETFATGFARPVDLKFGPDGSLYVLLRDAWVKDRSFRPGTGSLQKIVHR
ncbi:MAG: PQQ-dependent sugar dehydrogenase [Isosphaeraceae bacterium]